MLYIAEKPSVGMEIAKAIGGNIVRQDGFLEVSNTKITWCIGHLLENAKPDEYDPKYIQWNIELLPFIPEKWINRPRSKKDTYGRDKKNADGSIMLDPGIVKQLKIIGRLLKEARIVVNAGDSAREGQLIVDEILEFFQFKGPAKRLWLQEMNLPAIKKAIAIMKPNSEYRNTYFAALGRQSLDFLIGMNCTRGYTVACQSKGIDMVVHIGRVQTPVVCIVVARDLEIENFVPKNYFILRVNVCHQNGSFLATWIPAADSLFLDAEKRVTDRSIVEAVGKKVFGRNAVVLRYAVTPKSIAPPLPFSLGDLQKISFKMFGLSPTQTLDVVQALYEKHKLVTYPRTDYSYLPEGDHAYGEKIIEAARSNLGQQWDFPGTPDFNLKSPAWNDSKIGDHFAIRPADRVGYDINLLSSIEQKLYKLIVRQFLAQFYPHYKYDSTITDLECENERFKAIGKVDRQLGWKILFEGDGKVLDGEADSQVLPLMNVHDKCLIDKSTVEDKKTSPPPRFDGASLIDAMEKAHLYVTNEKVKKSFKEYECGIGTPATRASIIDFIVEREYVEEVASGKKKFYLSTEKARFLYKIVPDWLKVPDLTAYFEGLLRQVESGDLEYEVLISRQKLFIEKQIAAVKDGSVAAAIPAAGSYSQPKLAGKKGKRASVGKVGTGVAGKKSSKHGKGAKSEHGPCPKCGSAMLERKGSNGPFLGCSGYPNCRHTGQVTAPAR